MRNPLNAPASALTREQRLAYPPRIQVRHTLFIGDALATVRQLSELHGDYDKRLFGLTVDTFIQRIELANYRFNRTLFLENIMRNDGDDTRTPNVDE